MKNYNYFNVEEMTLEQQMEVSGGFNLNLAACIAGITMLVMYILERVSN